MTRIITSLAFAALLGTIFVSSAEAGIFGRRAYRPHYHAPRVEYRYYQAAPSYQSPSVHVIRHVNDPSMFRDQMGYGES
ncbi:hypothetical protein DTL42_15550 [Bremerella cremea]|uniref:Uncharacterized protein n=1 Tax=Bremerella cremea TaxID=1031537 RepID=A0A368KRG8_9BACT|nr:hypothetical protein [Bremerella cremea]RCS46381.1 hypothetical protein DTL42_15550 [Bremerella cremea]